MKFIILIYIVINSAFALTSFEDAVSKEHLKTITNVYEANIANLDLAIKCLEVLTSGENSFTEDQQNLMVNLIDVQNGTFGDLIPVGCSAFIDGTLKPQIYNSYGEMKIFKALSAVIALDGNPAMYLNSPDEMKFVTTSMTHNTIKFEMFDSINWGSIPALNQSERERARNLFNRYRIGQCLERLGSMKYGTFTQEWHAPINAALGRDKNLSNEEVCVGIILNKEVRNDSRLGQFVKPDGYAPAFKNYPITNAVRAVATFFNSATQKSKMKNHWKTQYLAHIDQLSILALINGPQPSNEELLHGFRVLRENAEKVSMKFSKKVRKFSTNEADYGDDLNNDFFLNILPEGIEYGDIDYRADIGETFKILPKFRKEFSWANIRELTNTRIKSAYTDNDLRLIGLGLDQYWKTVNNHLRSRSLIQTGLIMTGLGFYIGGCLWGGGPLVALLCGFTATSATIAGFVALSYIEYRHMVQELFSGVSNNTRYFKARNLEAGVNSARINVFMAGIFAGLIGGALTVPGVYNRTIGGKVRVDLDVAKEKSIKLRHELPSRVL